jgi:HEAT repeat protein
MSDEQYWTETRQQAFGDPRSNEELIRLALEIDDEAESEDDWEDSRGALLSVLQWRGTPEVFEAARRLCLSDHPKQRRLGVDVLGQNLAHWKTLQDQSVPLLLAMLETETEACVLTRIGCAFGHIGDERIVEPMVRLKNHPDAGIRWGVMCAMGAWELREHPVAIATLIELSADEDDDIRNWSTFDLAIREDVDSEDIRAALVERLDDSHDETRNEALLGLALKKDPRVMDALLRELSGPITWHQAIEAAKEMGDPRCYPLLLKQRDEWGNDPEVREYHREQLERAIEACRPE